MKNKRKIINSLLAAVCFFMCCICFPADCQPDNSAVIQKIAGYIADYNREQLRLSDEKNTYRGEEGILFIRPEAASKLGLRVYTDQDYTDAAVLYEKAADALEDAEKALCYSGRLEKEESLIQKIISNILVHKESSLLAKKRLVNYRKNLNRDQDDRLNPEICNRVIVTLLNEDLNETGNNLRDILARFHNKCNNVKQGRYFLAPENSRFVNSIFNRFIAQASPEELKPFDLDKNSRNGNSSDYGEWKKIVIKERSDLLPFIESAVEKHGAIYRTDPLLFLALIKRESSFRPRAISSVGAAGLTQLMPQTALDLGLKEIYMPDYFKKAGELSRTERESRAKARKMLLSISKTDDTQVARQAREDMQKSMKAGENRKELLKRYKKELSNDKNDDRFDIQKVIEAGYTYFTRLMKSFDGDISLALSSYNAGQHRVKEYNGIPPFKETVGFRNVILRYYSEYLEDLSH